MSITLSQACQPLFLRGLTALGAVLAKAAAHVEARNIQPDALLQARLYPDMLPLTVQVYIATDFAKGAVARLAGEEPPVYDNVETTFEDLQARVAKTIAYIRSVDPAKIDGQEDRDIALVRRGETSVFKAQPYLLEQALPNFYFHVATAYDLLRHNGVEIGKKDFLALD